VSIFAEESQTELGEFVSHPYKHGITKEKYKKLSKKLGFWGWVLTK
jgi:hypothetical protein